MWNKFSWLNVNVLKINLKPRERIKKRNNNNKSSSKNKTQNHTSEFWTVIGKHRAHPQCCCVGFSFTFFCLRRAGVDIQLPTGGVFQAIGWESLRQIIIICTNLLLSSGLVFVMDIIWDYLSFKSQNQSSWKGLWKVQPPAQSMVTQLSKQVSQDFLVGSWKPPRTVTALPLFVAYPRAQLSSWEVSFSFINVFHFFSFPVISVFHLFPFCKTGSRYDQQVPSRRALIPGSSDSGPVHLVQEAKADLFVTRASGNIIIMYFYMWLFFFSF